MINLNYVMKNKNMIKVSCEKGIFRDYTKTAKGTPVVRGSTNADLINSGQYLHVHGSLKFSND